MNSESHATANSSTIPELPPRRLLIVRELERFATDGIVCWTPELVQSLIDWSDLATDAPGVYRLALVSETLTTEQANQGFADLLMAWNDTRPEECQLQLNITYSNTASTNKGPRYRCDGSDRIGRVEFFTSEFFDRVSGRNKLDRSLGGWHGIIERCLKAHHIGILNWMPQGNYPDGWLDAGFVHQGEPYGHIVMLDRTPEGVLSHRLLTVSSTGTLQERLQ